MRFVSICRTLLKSVAKWCSVIVLCDRISIKLSCYNGLGSVVAIYVLVSMQHRVNCAGYAQNTNINTKAAVCFCALQLWY